MTQRILTFALQTEGHGFDRQEMNCLKTQLQLLHSGDCQVRAVFLWTFERAKAPSDHELEMNPVDLALFEDVLLLLFSVPQPLIGVAIGCIGAVGTGLLKTCDHVLANDSAQFWSDQTHEVNLHTKIHMSVQQAHLLGLVDEYAPLKELRAQVENIVQELGNLSDTAVALFKASLINSKIDAIDRKLAGGLPAVHRA
eukprot:TRINITY_DN42769_c0_g1_i1.p1 TRINITY_DN42769_c0_g1~~TRINITY_DN42769_c0_g1_i1.p1  ORF type:complete len:197 (-),score=27.52 TRINITY_DN42769_c0_g1_i1:533-1123(-)